MRRVAVVLMLMVACGGAEPPPEEASPTPEVTPEPSPEDAAPPDPPTGACTDATITGEVEATVRTIDNEFSPDCLIVLAGQTLRIVNRGSRTHNLTIEGGDVDLDVEPGATTGTEAIGGAVEPGTHGFFCSYHRRFGMEGELTVTDAG